MQKPTFKNKLFTHKKAFTLIELLIVIAIIGILFIVLISKVDFATDKAKATGVQTDFRSFQVAFDTVAKENAGFNTFGWDTGDTNGNRIRDSYDEGDINQNGVKDDDEVWIGHKVYAETFTGIYTLVKPGTDFSTVGYDKDVVFALESAINKNLDPKLNITIGTDGKIAMANGAQDPWNTEYHGIYLSNAAVDGKDRGAFIMYSNGANQEFGSEHSISNGIVTVNVPGNNKLGADDYSIVSLYTYMNGYGEVKNITTGFSNNQTMLGGTTSQYGGNIDIEQSENNLLSGLFDENGVQLVTWEDLINVYGLDIEKNNGHTSHGNASYTKNGTSLYCVLSNNESLASASTLVVDSTVTKLGEYALAECTQIKRVVIGESLSTISSTAFEKTQIEQFEVNNSNPTYQSIDGNLYSKDSYTLIRYASGKANNVFTITSNLQNISQYAFQDAKNLTRLNIEVGLVKTGYNAFSGCINLKDVYYNGNVTDWCEIAFAANVSPCDDEANPLCYGANLYFENMLVQDLIIPSTITKIKESSFVGCGSIINLYLPKELTTIKSGAFGSMKKCSNLKNVFYAGTVEDWMKISIKSSPMRSGANLYCQNSLITHLVVPSSITTIKSNTFQGCTSIVSVEMPNKVTKIDSSAFSYCINLKQVIFSESLTTIESSAFYDCISLEDFILPNTLQTVGQNAFQGCDSIVSVTIPESVTLLKQCCFRGDNLKTVIVLSTTPPPVQQGLMFGNTNLSQLKIYVPAESVDLYKQTTYWSTYKSNICAIE